MQKLDQIVAKYHLPRSSGKVLADLEHRLIGHRDVALINIVLQILQTVLQALALRLKRLFNGLRIGQKEIAGRRSVQHLLQKKFRTMTFTCFEIGTGD